MNILVDKVLENRVHKWSGTSNDQTWTLYCGDAEEALHNILDESVHCIVTSPPYYSLRDYGVDGQIGLEDTKVEGYCNSRRCCQEVYKRVPSYE